jgi:hypothetical protein
MAKRFKVEVLGTDVTAIAELQEQSAPRTCEALWRALEKPFQGKAIHAMYAGHEVFMGIPEENRTFDAEALPREAATAYPLPGDVLFGYFPAYMERDQPDALWEIVFVYGRETVMDSSLGIRPICVFAQIVEGLPEFAEQCARIRSDDGPKTFRVSRFPSDD